MNKKMQRAGSFHIFNVSRSLFRIFATLVCCACWLSAASGQQQYNFTHFGVTDGLSDSRVNVIVQDSRGFLWVGTNLGVSCFNGYSFTNYYAADGQRIGKVNSILEDHEGYLWIGSENGLFFRHGKQMQYVHAAGDSAAYYITTIFQDRKMNFWIGTPFGPVMLDTAGFRSMKAKRELEVKVTEAWKEVYEKTNPVVRLVHDPNGTLFLVTPGHLYSYDGKKFRLLWRTSATIFESPSSVFADDSGVYITHENSLLYRYAKGKMETIFPSSKFWVSMIASAKHDYLLLDHSSVIRYRKGNAERVFDLNAKGYEYPLCMLLDRERNLWIGTSEGLIRLKETPFTDFYPGEQLLNDIYTVTESPSGEAVFGGNRGNALVFRNGTFRSLLPGDLRAFPTSEIFTIFFHPDGSIWFGSGYQGISVYKNNRLYAYGYGKMPDSHVEQFFTDESGRFWALTEGGITEIRNASDPSALSFVYTSWGKHDGNRYIRPHEVLKIGDDYWIVSNQGLLQFEDGNYRKFLSGNAAFDNASLNSIAVSRDGRRVWVASDDSGIFQLENGKGQFRLEKHYTINDGLLSDVVRDVLVDKDNNIWVAHFNGLSFFSFSGDSLLGIKRTTASDGFLENDFQYIRLMQESGSGRIWVATTSGVQYFYPDRISFNPVLPTPVINEVLLFKGEIPLEKYIREMDDAAGIPKFADLPYNRNSITFKFQSVSLSDSKLNRCRYRLEGYDSTWTTASGIDEVTFAALGPGRYTFVLEASNNDGIWNPVQASVSFRIAKPFWVRGWFLVAMVMLTAAISFMIYRYRIYQLTRMNEMRNKIAGDLHDDIGSTLSSINMYSQMINHNLRETNPEVVPFLTKISENARETIETMSDIVWTIKSDNDGFQHIESRMLNFALELCVPGNIELVMPKDSGLDSLKITMEKRRDLYLIFKEAVNNAVKYSGCSVLTVKFAHSGGKLRMQVEDNGKGISGGKSTGGNGLVNMHQRARKHGGELTVASSESGTTIQLFLPIP